MKVLVTGGAGYIGSIAAALLIDSGYEVAVLDDLSTGHADAVPSLAKFIQGSLLNDSDLDQALDLIIKLISKPDVPSATAPALIVKLQAISAKLSVLARYYTTFEKGGDASKKKNTYYTAADAIDKLVDALKYSARYGS